MDEIKRLFIHTVAWNSMAFIPYLAASLEQQDMHEATFTIIDNASGDGIASWIQAHRPDITVLRNFRNQGRAKAANQAIALARSHCGTLPLEQCYIMSISPDVEFAPGAIQIMVAYMDAHPDVAACGPKRLRATVQGSYDEDRPEMLHSTIIDSTGLVMQKTRRAIERGAGEEDRGQYDTSIDVFGFSHTCVLFRVSAVCEATIDGEVYDEDFFECLEDVDLAWRMRRLGYVARYIPEAVVWHHSSELSSATRFLFARNQLWVNLKNDEVINVLLHLPWRLAGGLWSWILACTSWSKFKGQWSAFLGIPRMLQKRYALSRVALCRGANIRTWFV